jgi:ubiquitin-like 1-activating enzyme E1 A
MQTHQNLDKAEFEVYDRQLRLWGFEAQARMKESKVMVLGFSNAITELSRHLVLSGINIDLVSLDATQ